MGCDRDKRIISFVNKINIIYLTQNAKIPIQI